MKNIVAFLSLGLLIASCTPTPTNTTPPIGTTGNLEVTLNGALWTGTSFNNTIVYANQQGVTGNRMDIRAFGSDGKQLILTVSDTTRSMGEAWVNPDYYHTDTISRPALVTMMQGNTTLLGMAAFGILGYGEITVTACNPITQLVSGTFSFEIYDPADSTLLFDGMNGTFTDCQYNYYQ